MNQQIEVLKIANVYPAKPLCTYKTETEILGVFSESYKVYEAIANLGINTDDFDYLNLKGDIPDDAFGVVLCDNEDGMIVIYWETYDLDELMESYIWDEYRGMNL